MNSSRTVFKVIADTPRQNLSILTNGGSLAVAVVSRTNPLLGAPRPMWMAFPLRMPAAIASWARLSLGRPRRAVAVFLSNIGRCSYPFFRDAGLSHRMVIDGYGEFRSGPPSGVDAESWRPGPRSGTCGGGAGWGPFLFQYSKVGRAYLPNAGRGTRARRACVG